MFRRNASLFPRRSNQIFNDLSTQRSLQFELLMHGRKGRVIKSRAWNIVEADYGTVFRHPATSFRQGPDGSTRTEIVKGN